MQRRRNHTRKVAVKRLRKKLKSKQQAVMVEVQALAV
jgi:hypothetical protein